MGHTYSNLLFHVIFSTKDRQPLILIDWRTRLYEYMCGIGRGEFGAVLCVGGVADHVHGLISLRTDRSVAHAMNRWKSLSSGWVNQELRPPQRFAWQVGYAAFSVSQSAKDAVAAYIEQQEEHHRQVSFQDELLMFLKRHNITYDPAHVFD